MPVSLLSIGSTSRLQTVAFSILSINAHRLNYAFYRVNIHIQLNGPYYAYIYLFIDEKKIKVKTMTENKIITIIVKY